MRKEYFINDEKETVVCRVLERRNFLFDKIGDNPTLRYVYDLYGSQSDYDKVPIIGKAVCSELDEYDVEVGKKVASVKADIRLYKTLMQDLNSIEKNLDKALKHLYRRKQETQDKITKMENFLSKF